MNEISQISTNTFVSLTGLPNLSLAQNEIIEIDSKILHWIKNQKIWETTKWPKNIVMSLKESLQLTIIQALRCGSNFITLRQRLVPSFFSVFGSVSVKIPKPKPKPINRIFFGLYRYRNRTTEYVLRYLFENKYFNYIICLCHVHKLWKILILKNINFLCHKYTVI